MSQASETGGKASSSSQEILEIDWLLAGTKVSDDLYLRHSVCNRRLNMDFCHCNSMPCVMSCVSGVDVMALLNFA